MDMEEVLQMDENQFHQTLSDLETCERVSQFVLRLLSSIYLIFTYYLFIYLLFTVI